MNAFDEVAKASGGTVNNNENCDTPSTIDAAQLENVLIKLNCDEPVEDSDVQAIKNSLELNDNPDKKHIHFHEFLVCAFSWYQPSGAL